MAPLLFVQSVQASGTDSDGDGYLDEDEIAAGTDPYDPASYPGAGAATMDSDGDGFTDEDEVAAGSDPYDPTSFPFIDSDGDGYGDVEDTAATRRNGMAADTFSARLL